MDSISRICIVENCERAWIAKKLCGKHYQRSKNGLDLNAHFRDFHGKTKSVEYTTWLAMKQRCYDDKYIHYHHYGGRGITVCERWLHSFENFLKDMGLRPEGDYSIERLDTNGNYEPDNCIWATKIKQMNNTTRNIYHKLGNASYTIPEWSRISGVNDKVITSRIKLGWNLSDAIFKPPR